MYHSSQPTANHGRAGHHHPSIQMPTPIIGPRSASAQGHSHHQHHSHHHRHQRVHSSGALPLKIPASVVDRLPRQVSDFLHSVPQVVSAAPSSRPASSHSRPPASTTHHLNKPAVPNNGQHSGHGIPTKPGSGPGTFQYSKCTGRKRALCIGINYLGMNEALRGCINDARHVREFLIKRWGYKPEDIVILTDDNPNPRSMPTRANILDAMRWLVRNAQPNDSLVFHYSGHGGQVKDKDGDEVDGLDEVIYPVDFKTSRYIVDDEMHRIMVKPLPRGCRLTCCNSGTALDLPYIYGSDGRLKGRHVSQKAYAQKGTSADVITWSGSKDDQTSADTFAGGLPVGAMSFAFITSLRSQPKQSYQELLNSVRKILYPKYSQKPQLASSHPIDTSLRFIL
ncbi:hypothetical protein CYLTODRAFT_416504 [Cylindrobasidium torrendii FP15055 ss-10]|uniref:Peptidase C14 caspase domain-containing protein n=1 Tax=Cylindrobasidium torrendii FP15055 ss-10 TaxID=1314674 RepID=A0A0D7BUJ6_9AGAR|nr:hypothetical protein CYLTODRAFT_416504 [Cylindrobasidium torrendii FP15055 ss-10]